MSVSEILLFCSTTSPKCRPCLEFVQANPAVNEFVQIIRLDTKETREAARTGRAFQILAVPTLVVFYPDGNYNTFGGEKAFRWLNLLVQQRPVEPQPVESDFAQGTFTQDTSVYAPRRKLSRRPRRRRETRRSLEAEEEAEESDEEGGGLYSPPRRRRRERKRPKRVQFREEAEFAEHEEAASSDEQPEAVDIEFIQDDPEDRQQRQQEALVALNPKTAPVAAGKMQNVKDMAQQMEKDMAQHLDQTHGGRMR